jgi:hypothetical protein
MTWAQSLDLEAVVKQQIADGTNCHSLSGDTGLTKRNALRSLACPSAELRARDQTGREHLGEIHPSHPFAPND